MYGSLYTHTVQVMLTVLVQYNVCIYSSVFIQFSLCIVLLAYIYHSQNYAPINIVSRNCRFNDIAMPQFLIIVYYS